MAAMAETVYVSQANIGDCRILRNGNAYWFVEDVDFTAAATESALKVAGGARVEVVVPKGVAVKLTGGAASGTTGAGAGIEVPQDATLVIRGAGELFATGGAAANGANGGQGASGYVSSARPQTTSATGGAGGFGGGGAGAGIGGAGGVGGAGGAAGAKGGDGTLQMDPTANCPSTGSYDVGKISDTECIRWENGKLFRIKDGQKTELAYETFRVGTGKWIWVDGQYVRDESTRQLDGGKWYVLKDVITRTDSINVGEGEAANLVLLDRAALTVDCQNNSQIGICVSEGRALNIFGVASGTLTAIGGIGGGDNGTAGALTVYGGEVTATGGTHAAGIGGGEYGAGGAVTINGGIVTAFGGGDERPIGAGYYGPHHGSLLLGPRVIKIDDNHYREGVVVSFRLPPYLRLASAVDESGKRLRTSTRDGMAFVVVEGPLRTTLTFDFAQPGYRFTGSNAITVGPFTESVTLPPENLPQVRSAALSFAVPGNVRLSSAVAENGTQVGVTTKDGLTYFSTFPNAGRVTLTFVPTDVGFLCLNGSVITVDSIDENATLPASDVPQAVENLIAGPVKYLLADGSEVSTTGVRRIGQAASQQDTLASGWYVTAGDMRTSVLNVRGTVNLVLSDGATLTVNGGIRVEPGNTLNIHCQRGATGTLFANGDQYSAGIGGSNPMKWKGYGLCGTVTNNAAVSVAADAALAIGLATGADEAESIIGVFNYGEWAAIGGSGSIFVNSGTLAIWADERAINATGSLSYGADEVLMTGRTPETLRYASDCNSEPCALVTPGVTVMVKEVPHVANFIVSNAVQRIERIPVEGGAEYRVLSGEDVFVGYTLEEGYASKSANPLAYTNVTSNITVDAGKIQIVQTVSYRAWNETTRQMENRVCTDYAVVTNATATFEDGGWYVVTNDVGCSAITVNGAAHLILCDGATLTAGTLTGGSLSVYAQAENGGVLVPAVLSTALTVVGGNVKAGISVTQTKNAMGEDVYCVTCEGIGDQGLGIRVIGLEEYGLEKARLIDRKVYLWLPNGTHYFTLTDETTYYCYCAEVNDADITVRPVPPPELVTPGEPSKSYTTAEEATNAARRAVLVPTEKVVEALETDEAIMAYCNLFGFAVTGGGEAWFVKATLYPEAWTNVTESASQATRQIPLADIAALPLDTPTNVTATCGVPGFYYSLYDGSALTNIVADAKVVFPEVKKPSDAAGFFSIGVREVPGDTPSDLKEPPATIDVQH